MVCKICGGDSWVVLYRGKIRLGKFGEWSDRDCTVYKCNRCKAGFLPQENFSYETDEYRLRVEGDASIEHFRQAHDREQAEKLGILGTDGWRDKIVADIGCGGGSFLDFLSGVARETVAIEPCLSYRLSLTQKHKYFPGCSEALREYAGKVDVAVSFAVIEHTDNPLQFLREIRQLIKPGGYLLLSTPNYDDWLIDFLSGFYDRFFYRAAHTWYFNGESLKQLATLAGFKQVSIRYKQRFDLSNALHWIRDHRPTGWGKTLIFHDLDGVYQQHLEGAGQSDFLYARLSG
jgi:2-polyprenyl-3-methyl-5-hydroxy-6-metoxy-1,4-benzoquinol methylase